MNTPDYGKAACLTGYSAGLAKNMTGRSDGTKLETSGKLARIMYPCKP